MAATDGTNEQRKCKVETFLTEIHIIGIGWSDAEANVAVNPEEFGSVPVCQAQKRT